MVILERAEQVGGLSASFSLAGVTVDHGSHRLHSTIAPGLLQELRALLGDELRPRRRDGRIRLGGRWVRFPLSPANLLRALPPGLVIRAGRDVLTSPWRRPRSETFEEVLRAKMGPALCAAFWFPYARKLWGVEPAELDVELARRRVSSDSAGALLARLVRAAVPDAFARKERGKEFLYPDGGFGRLAEALADAASHHGAELWMGSPVQALHRPAADAGAWDVRAGGETIRARRVWSTLPLPVLVRLVRRPAPPADVQTAATGLRTRGMVLVYLVLDRDSYTEHDAHYLPGPETPVSRVSEPKRYRGGRGTPGRTALCAELPANVGDAWWRASDEELAATVVATLSSCGLPPVEPIATHVRRLPSVYPVYTRGYARDLATVEHWAAALPDLLTFGRQGLFAHDNTHHALGMAYEACSALCPDGRFDEQAWAAARARFREHVVED